MGLKSKFSKMKSFLFDEEEEKEVKVKSRPEKNIKKERKEDFHTKKIDEVKDFYFEDLSDDYSKNEQIKSRSEIKEKEFSFPDFEDFMVATKKPEPIIKEEKKKESRTVLYQGSKRKEESKKFKPTPIISPIYGLLDDEGNTISDSKKEIISNDEVSLDDIRKKAYGSFDRNLDDTIKNLSSKTIEEAEKEMEEKELSREKAKKEKKKIVEEEAEEDDDDMILPNVSFKEIDVDKRVTKEEKKEKKVVDDDDDDDDTKEQDLFNLIDTMYQKQEDDD